MKKRTILYVGGFELPDRNAQRVLSVAKIFKSIGYNVIFLGIDKISVEETKKEYFGFESWAIPYPKRVDKTYYKCR